MFDPFSKARRYLPRSLFWRTFLILFGSIFLAQVATTYVFFDRHWARMTDRLAQSVAGEIATLRDVLEHYGTTQNNTLLEDIRTLYAEHMKLAYSFSPQVTRVLQTNTYSSNLEIDARLKAALDARVKRPYLVEVSRKTKEVRVYIQLKNGLLTILLPQNRLYDSSGFIFILWLNGLALLFFVVAILFMRNQIRPIRKLAIAADKFGRGDRSVELKPAGAREVRQATESFLNMMERIHRQMHQRTSLLAGVSHDMRTPLTRMRLQVSLMDKSEDADALLGDIKAMEQMIDSYLSFVRDAADEPSQSMDIVPLLTRMADDFKREEKEVQLNLPKTLVLLVKPVAFERAVTNILRNAFSHGAPPVTLTAKVDMAASQALLMVDDAGQGIDPEKRVDVFKPFVRLAPKTSAKGAGLGLSIAQDVVLSHGGRLELSESPQGGLRVVAHLPLADDRIT